MLRLLRVPWSLAAAAALIAGCCSTPRAERYFDRATPFDALNGFAYAVETGQYDFAYDTLNRRSQELLPFSRFKLALRFGARLPELDVPIRDLILKAERSRGGVRMVGTRRAAVTLIYRLSERDIVAPTIFLEREEPPGAAGEGIWKIDLESTIADYQGQLAEITARTGRPGGEGAHADGPSPGASPSRAVSAPPSSAGTVRPQDPSTREVGGQPASHPSP